MSQSRPYASWSALLTVSLTASSLAAQVPGTVTVANSCSASTTVQGVTSTATEPGGLAPAILSRIVGSQNTAAAGFGWNVSTSPGDPAMQTTISCTVNLSVLVPNASATKPTSDLLVTLYPSFALPVRFEASRFLDLNGTNQQPLWEVDLGDDGSIEYAASMSFLLAQPRIIGPGPYTIRIRTGADLQQIGSVQFAANLRVLPDGGVSVTPTMPACSVPELPVVATFANSGHDLLWLAGYSTFAPKVGVIGFGLQPALLPMPLALAPTCLLLPSPDVLFLVPPSATTPTTLAIPAALRPVQLWTQAVSLEPQGLATTTAYRIDAQ